MSERFRYGPSDEELSEHSCAGRGFRTAADAEVHRQNLLIQEYELTGVRLKLDVYRCGGHYHLREMSPKLAAQPADGTVQSWAKSHWPAYLAGVATGALIVALTLVVVGWALGAFS